jgi:hypothetical protein
MVEPRSQKELSLIWPLFTGARPDFKSVGVVVHLYFMTRMDVIVRTMVAGVLVVMNQHISMIMPMLVLVVMLVAVCVRVLMGMSHVPMTMCVRMAVGVFVGMQMLMFVVALHCELLSFGVGVG